MMSSLPYGPIPFFSSVKQKIYWPAYLPRMKACQVYAIYCAILCYLLHETCVIFTFLRYWIYAVYQDSIVLIRFKVTLTLKKRQI
jgi:hypothetical protein